MKNTEQLINQSEKIFTDFQKVNESLYRGKLSVQDKIAGVYYLNFNEEISETNFEELQYKYLAEEFYKQEESLQWNIYLLFINSIISEELKSKILKDDKYARKLIFDDNQFIDYFKLEKSEDSELPDIITEWKEELNSVGLQEVYSDIPYVKAVDNFIKNKTPKLSSRSKSEKLDDVPIVKKISSIYLEESYRKFPKIREFTFGSVNLITGSNGVGKTSLLEAIELMLTGGTLRNYEKIEVANSISATYNNNIKDSYTHNRDKYKSRGAKWYKRRLTEKGNQTFKSFNQFNFFNTDAALLFANSEHKSQINTSLKSIILGEEYTILKDRINGFEHRLNSEFNNISKELERKEKQVENNKKRIEELKSDESLERIEKTIKQNIIDLNYKRPIEVSEYNISSLFINEIKTELDFILKCKWGSNFATFINKKAENELRIKTVSINKDEYEGNIQEINRLNKNIKDLTHNISLIDQLIRYSEIKGFEKIENLEINLSKANVQIKLINSLKDLHTLELDIYKFKNETKNINILISDKEDIIKNKKESLIQLESEIKLIQNNFSTIEKLKNEIKLLGKEFLKHDQHSEKCPLCEQGISHSELIKKIEYDFTKEFDKSLLNKKTSEYKSIKKVLNFEEKEYKKLTNYRNFTRNFLEDYQTLTINEIDNRLKIILEKEKDILKEIEVLNKIQFQLDNISGSVSEYKNLKEKVVAFLPQNSKIEKTFLIQFNSKLNENKKAILSEIDTKVKANDKIISNLNSSLKLKEYTEDIYEIEKIVKSNEITLNSINQSFENLKSFIDIPNDKSLNEVAKALALLNENLVSYRSLLNTQNEVNKLLNENKEINDELPNIKILFNRLKKAVRILKKLNSNNEDSILDDYFRDNLTEIKDIFRTIHSPQEFSDLRYEDSNLVLFKNMDKHQISEISTGQRTALVLSIFISLNRKLKNGPDILIFDDPVAFIDDFNALSFLDFLRYFIVKEKKQIFFATANKKFSALFKKKFDFIGKEEFKEFQLER